MQIIGHFWAEVFGLKEPQVAGDKHLISHEDVHLKFPQDGRSTGEMVEALTGITMPEGLTLPDIFKPVYKGEELDADMVVKELENGEVMRILSQFELALEGRRSNVQF